MTNGRNIQSVSSSTRLSVAVVIPTRNRSRFIGLCLDSVRAQTLQPDSVIVVDDGSTDDTPRILEHYAQTWPALRIIRTPPNGVSAARNAALAVAKAELVALIDDDDLWDPDKLARQVDLFSTDRPRLALVYCGLRQINSDGLLLANARVLLPTCRGDIFKDVLEQFHGIAPSTIVARRSAILSVGGFDEELIQAEDRDLCLKITRQWEVDCVTDALVSLRVHDEGTYVDAMQRAPDFVLFQRLKVWDRWFETIEAMAPVLNRFRAEAISTSVALIFRPNPDFTLYRRLATSEFQLARRLFKSRLDYVLALLPHLTSAPFFTVAKAAASARSFAELKVVIATYYILPNARLLRLAQRCGRFKNVESAVRPFGRNGHS